VVVTLWGMTQSSLYLPSCKVPGDEGELEESRDVDLSQTVGSAFVIG